MIELNLDQLRLTDSRIVLVTERRDYDYYDDCDDDHQWKL